MAIKYQSRMFFFWNNLECYMSKEAENNVIKIFPGHKEEFFVTYSKSFSPCSGYSTGIPRTYIFFFSTQHVSPKSTKKEFRFLIQGVDQCFWLESGRKFIFSGVFILSCDGLCFFFIWRIFLEEVWRIFRRGLETPEEIDFFPFLERKQDPLITE